MNVKIYLNISHTLLRVCEDEINWSYDCIQTDQDLKIDLLVGEGRKQRSGESGAGGRCQLHPGRWMSFTRSSLLNAQIIFDQHIGVCSVKSVGRTPIKQQVSKFLSDPSPIVYDLRKTKNFQKSEMVRMFCL